MNNLFYVFLIILIVLVLIFGTFYKVANVDWNIWGPAIQFTGAALVLSGLAINFHNNRESQKPENVEKRLRAITTSSLLKEIVDFRNLNDLTSVLLQLKWHEIFIFLSDTLRFHKVSFP